MTFKKFKFVTKKTLQYGYNFFHWYRVCHGDKINRWRNPNCEKALEPTPIHVLSGEDQFAMAFWMLASWLHMTNKNWKVVLHDDGSLDPRSVETLLKAGIEVQFICATRANERVQAILKEFPKCLAHRKRSCLAKKFYDSRIYAETEKYFVLDTDLLFLKYPKELVSWNESSSQEFLFNRDVKESNQISKIETMNAFGFELWDRVNSGLSCVVREGIQFEDSERFLSHGSLDQSVDDWMLEQTLYALHAAQWGKGGLLPATYELSLGREKSQSCICRHYVGAIRELFYTEGVKELSQSLS